MEMAATARVTVKMVAPASPRMAPATALMGSTALPAASNVHKVTYPIIIHLWKYNID